MEIRFDDPGVRETKRQSERERESARRSPQPTISELYIIYHHQQMPVPITPPKMCSIATGTITPVPNPPPTPSTYTGTIVMCVSYVRSYGTADT